MQNKLFLSDKYIEVQNVPHDTETKEKLQKFYPVHSNRIGTVHKLSSRLCPEVLGEFRDIDDLSIYAAPANVQKRYLDEMFARRGVEDILTFGPRDPGGVVNEHLTLMRHQQMAREIAQFRKRFCFFYDTRTGKTPMSLAIMLDDIKVHPNHKWLVVCPLILIENAWLLDASEFVPELKVVNCHASTPKKRRAKMGMQANIYITNTESFVTWREEFEKMGFAGCFVDESSSMKSHRSAQSKALVEFAQTLDRFYLLSGTPAPNGEWEYYMQLRSVDFFCVPPSYTQFKERYFINISHNVQFDDLVLRPDMKDELYGILRKYAVYVDKEDVLETPGRDFVPVYLTMPDKLKEAYNKMKHKLAVEMDNNGVIITAPSSAAKLNKLNQITSGFIIDTQAIKENKFYDTDTTEWYLLDRFRFKSLEDLLRSDGVRGEQVLIWANYRAEFELIQKALGDRCRCIYGGTTIAEKNEAIKLFKSGEVQYLVANPASADKGLTLTNAHIAIYFSLNWSYELFKQSMERIYGGVHSQKNRCTYYIIMAEGTIDVILYEDVLQGKGTASYAVLNHLKAGDI